MSETMIDQIRIALYILLALVVFFMFQAWELEHSKTATPQSPATTVANDRILPTIPATKNAEIKPTTTPAPTVTTENQKGEIVTVKTDVLEILIDTRGGDIIQAKLLKYPEALHSTTPFILLNDNADSRYIAESGLLSELGPDTVNNQANYQVQQKSYELIPSQNELAVQLHWMKDGLDVIKTFHFARDSYEVKVTYDIKNNSNTAWQGNLYSQLMRKNTPPKTHGGIINLTTYFGAAVSSPEKPFLKIPFKEMNEKNFSQTVTGGWAAMIQHYFISAWIPDRSSTSTYYTRVSPSGLYTVGMISQPIIVQPGAQTTVGSKLYTGPAIGSRLENAAPGLKLTIDFGWFWLISGAIFWLMQKIYDVIGNWGWAIVLVTVLIKLLFYQLSAKSYRSMSALKDLQPRVEALKQKYGDDRQKLTQATLELYKQEKVNPMSGCLPILIQIPVFIALYWVLVESVELRQAPFILWIHDLSQPDPWYALPFLMMVSMFVQQRLNPPPPDPLQAKVMMAMPLVFLAMFANFPAGLMLYWVVNNTLSFLQQWFIMHHARKAALSKRR